MADYQRIINAHAALAAVAFVGLFPTGGIIIRLANFKGYIWVHAALQLLSYAMFIAAFGLGVYFAQEMDMLNNHHPIIGIIVFAMMFTQPVTGFVHHALFKKYERRTLLTFVHINIGRIAIILGMINGGLGLQLAQATRSQYIAYGVLAGLMGVAYISSAIYGEVKRSRRNKMVDQNQKGVGSEMNETNV